jgi:hypothetical protein
MEVLRRAMTQAKAEDGCRYTRWAVIRQSLKQLRDTVLKDAQAWFSGIGEWKVSEGTFHLNFADVRSELIFIPLENEDDRARLLSLQLTGAWLNEAIETQPDVLAHIAGRIGRYPSGNRGQPTWMGIIGDTNYPVELSPWWKLMTEPPADWQIFHQPSGLAHNAENLDFLLQTEETKKLPMGHPVRQAQGRKYYDRFVAMYGTEHPWIKRYVMAQYGDDPSGEAVFRSTFKPSFHVVDDTLVIPGYTLVIGIDFGRNPWSLIAQLDHLGRLVVHREIPATNVGLEKQVNDHIKPILYSEKFIGSKCMMIGDPSGTSRGTIAEESCFDALKRLGFAAFPAPTNDIAARLRAVEALLGRQTNGGPALMISRRGCPLLVRAMAGGYRYAKHKDGGLRAIPNKFDADGFSHVADCLQYLCLVVHGGLMTEFAKRLTPRPKRNPVPISAAGWT